MEDTLTEAPVPKKKVVRRKKRKPYASKAPKVEKTTARSTEELKALIEEVMLPEPVRVKNELERVLGKEMADRILPPAVSSPPPDDPALHMAAQANAIQEDAVSPPPGGSFQYEQFAAQPTYSKETLQAAAALTANGGSVLVKLDGSIERSPARTCIPVIPYWSAMWKPCADAFASNVDCVIVINVPPQKKELGFWRSAVKTIKANQEAETQSRERKGKPPLQVRLVGYLSPHHDDQTTRQQMRRYEQELQIREFWADARKPDGACVLECDHYGDEHTPLPLTIAQEGTLRVGYATNKTWRAEWEKARQTGRYVALLEDVSMLMPPNWWRDWLRSQLTK